MMFIEFLEEVNEIYTIIIKRQNSKRIDCIKSGYEVTRISFENIDLEDIFASRLIPLLRPMFDYYKSYKDMAIINKIYKIYIAILCEIAKRGFIQGGILKTMDFYMGCKFGRNKHYELLKKSLEYENIPIILNRAHLYEETIICEAGIPKTFHRKVLSMFLLYWKWMKGIDKVERKQFLIDFINEIPIYNNYILDENDYKKMKIYLDEAKKFKEKTIKVCNKLEEIFINIDEYPDLINENNINLVCERVSNQLQFNIETVLRTEDIKKEFLKYSQRISFYKLQKIINNLSFTEKIQIPTGNYESKLNYNFYNFYGGLHKINEIIYEVSYPVGLTLEELFNLPRQSVVKQNQNYIYTSEKYFEAEVDDIPQNVRQFIYNNEELYIFSGKIPGVSVAYIDCICIHSEVKYKLNACLRNFWDRNNNVNCLSIYLKEAKCWIKEFAMRSAIVSIDDDKIVRQVKENGYSNIQDKWSMLKNVADEQMKTIKYTVDSMLMEEITLPIEPIMIFSFQSGVRIQSTFDIQQFYGEKRIIIFAKEPIVSSSVKVVYKGMANGLYLYNAEIDITHKFLSIENLTIAIINKNHEYMVFSTKYSFKSETICFSYRDDISLIIYNLNIDGVYYLKINHDMKVEKIELNNLIKNECVNLNKLIENYDNSDGKWNITLYNGQKNVFELNYVILPSLRVILNKNLYVEGETVIAEIFADTNSFMSHNMLHMSTKVEIGKAQIDIIGNLVAVNPISYEVYNSRCECFQEVIAMPSVWGIRVIKYGNKMWDLFKDILIKYKDLDKYDIFLCSSKHTFINFECNEKIVEREVKPGFNKFSLRYAIDNWKMINQISFYDLYNMKQSNRIVFEPDIKYIKELYDNESLIYVLKYQGPLEVNILFRVYSNGKLVKEVRKKAEEVIYYIDVVIENIKKYNGQEVELEVIFDNRDSILLKKQLVSIKERKNVTDITQYCYVRKLLDIWTQKEYSLNSNKLGEVNVLDLLEGGSI